MKTIPLQNRMKFQDYLLLLTIFLVPLVLGYHRSPLSELESKLMGQANFIDLFNYWKAVVLTVFSIGISLLMGMDWLLGSRQLLKKRIVISIALFSLAVAVSVIASIDKTVALRGVIDRYEGAWVWFSYIVIIVATFEAAQRSLQFRKVFPIVLLTSSTIIGVIALLQYYGFSVLNQDFIRYAIAPKVIADAKKDFFIEGGFPMGTLSNPNYLGGYMSAVSLIAFWMCYKGRNKVLQILFLSMAALSLSALVVSRSSAGLAGFALTIPVLLYSVAERNGSRKTLTIAMEIVLGAVLLICVSTKNLEMPREIAFEGAYILMLTAILLLKGKTVLKWVAKKEILVVGVIIVMFFGVGGSYLYGQKQLHNPEYLSKIEVRDNRVEFDFSAGKLSLLYENGTVVAIGPDGNVIKATAVKTAANQYTYELNEGPFSFMKYDLAKEKEYDVVKIQPAGILFVVTGSKISWVDTSRSLGEIKNTSFVIKGIESLGSGRGYIWSRSLGVVTNHLVVGAGPDNFIFVFPQNDPAGKAMMGGANLYIDKPHNIYLKILIEFGLLGFASFIYIIWLGMKNGLTGFFNKEDDGIFAAVVLSLIAFSISSIFNDSLPSVTPIMMALLGFSLAGKYCKESKAA